MLPIRGCEGKACAAFDRKTKFDHKILIYLGVGRISYKRQLVGWVEQEGNLFLISFALITAVSENDYSWLQGTWG